MTTMQPLTWQETSAQACPPIRAMFVHRWGVIMAGGEIWLKELIVQLRKQNVAISVALHINGSLYTTLRDMGVATHLTELDFLRATPRSELLTSSVGLLRSALRLWGLIKATRVQVIHAFSAEAAEPTLLAARLAQVPCVATIMNCGPYPRFDVHILRHFDAVIAISRAVEADLLASHVPAERMHLIPLGIQFDHSSPITSTDIRNELGLPTDAQLIGLVATLERKKAQDVLIRAAQTICDRFPHAHIVFIGKDHATAPGKLGAYEAELRQLATDLKLTHRVHFLGYRADAAALMHQFDVAVLCSRKEALGLAAVEALAAGVPLVASAVEGLKEVVDDGETALLIPPDDPPALAQAVTRILANPAFGSQLAARGSRTVRERYDAAQLAKRNQHLYTTLLT